MLSNGFACVRIILQVVLSGKVRMKYIILGCNVGLSIWCTCSVGLSIWCTCRDGLSIFKSICCTCRDEKLI